MVAQLKKELSTSVAATLKSQILSPVCKNGHDTSTPEGRYPNGNCKQCFWEYTHTPEFIARRRAKKNSDYGRRKTRENKLKTRYGISLEEYDAMFVRQSGVCAICKCPEGYGPLVVDHSHRTTYVRKLLCRACNIGLGCFKDSPELMAKAIEYLKDNAT